VAGGVESQSRKAVQPPLLSAACRQRSASAAVTPAAAAAEAPRAFVSRLKEGDSGVYGYRHARRGMATVPSAATPPAW